MPEEVKIWKIMEGDKLKEIGQTKLNLENRLECWLENDISIISNNLLIIGRQVRTVFGGKIDLLCLERNGDAVVIELKRDKTPKDVVAQVLDYGSWVSDLSNDKISEIAKEYLGDNGPLEEAFKDKFNEDMPEVLNENHKLLIVASDMDSSSERIVSYLSNSYGVGINTVSFQYLKDDDGSEFVARVFLIAPSQVEQKIQTGSASKRRQQDKIDLFMYTVKENLSQRLTSGLMPKSSRWAGRVRDGSERYFNFWYMRKPWHSWKFCFENDLETNETESDYGKVYVSFCIHKPHLESEGISEKTTFALQHFLKNLEGCENFEYQDSEEYFYLGKYVTANNLSSEESEVVADALAWLIGNVVPSVEKILVVEFTSERDE